VEKRAAGEAGEESKAGQTSQTGSIGVYAVGTMGRGKVDSCCDHSREACQQFDTSLKVEELMCPLISLPVL